MMPPAPLVVLQTVTTLPVPADFDLAQVRPAEPRCGNPDGETVVVCAPKAMDIIVADAAALIPEPVLPQMGLPGGGTLGVTTVQRRDGPPALVIGLRLPF